MSNKYKTRALKLNDLLAIEGIDEDDAYEIANDSYQPGICMNDNCDYTTQVEPDSDSGYCEDCNTTTVESLQSLLLF